MSRTLKHIAEPSHARERWWQLDFQVNINFRPVMRGVMPFLDLTHNVKHFRLHSCMLLILVVTFLPGCSYYYQVHLEGQLLVGPECKPIRDATVTLFAGKMNYQTVKTDVNGRWYIEHPISLGEFGSMAEDGRRLHENISAHPYQLRITFEEREIVMPFPRLYSSNNSQDIYATVLSIIDLQSQPQSVVERT